MTFEIDNSVSPRIHKVCEEIYSEIIAGVFITVIGCLISQFFSSANCSTPNAMKNASVTKSGMMESDIATYTCDSNYRFLDADAIVSVTCLPDTEWSKPQYSCLCK